RSTYELTQTVAGCQAKAKEVSRQIVGPQPQDRIVFIGWSIRSRNQIEDQHPTLDRGVRAASRLKRAAILGRKQGAQRVEGPSPSHVRLIPEIVGEWRHDQRALAACLSARGTRTLISSRL